MVLQRCLSLLSLKGAVEARCRSQSVHTSHQRRAASLGEGSQRDHDQGALDKALTQPLHVDVDLYSLPTPSIFLLVPSPPPPPLFLLPSLFRPLAVAWSP